MNLVFNLNTKKQIDNYLAKPSHALLLVGPEGSGKDSLANYISSRLLDVKQEKLDSYPYIYKISPINNSISIDEVRKLHEFTKLKTVGNKNIRRIIIIESVNRMTREAQNAFLKLLEEPPEDTVLVMYASNVRDLLPTVLSRANKLIVQNPSKPQTIKHFISLNHDEESIKRAFSISQGSIGLMSAILDDDGNHKLVNDIGWAKEILGLSIFDRLKKVDEISKNKESIPDLLNSLKRISKVMLDQTAETQKTHEALAWQKRLKTLLKAQITLTKNPQPKLFLTNLFINL